MNSIQDLITKYKELKHSENQPISERHELVEKFAKKINESRARDGLKPLRNAFLNKKMADAGLKTNQDLYWFYAYCNDAKNFDKCWWWSLKVK